MHYILIVIIKKRDTFFPRKKIYDIIYIYINIYDFCRLKKVFG